MDCRAIPGRPSDMGAQAPQPELIQVNAITITDYTGNPQTYSGLEDEQLDLLVELAERAGLDYNIHNGD